MNTSPATEAQPTPSNEPRPYERTRKLLRSLYYMGCNFLLLCILIEVGWRVGGFSKGTKSEEAATSPLDVPYTLHPFFQTAYRPDRDTLPGPFLAGWRADPTDQAQATDRNRVMFLGGSTTANLYPHYTRIELDRDVGATTIYNLGFDWHCSLHSLYKFWTYYDDVHPELVVVLENINDFYRGFTSPDTSLKQYRSDYSHSCGGLHPFWVPGVSRFDQREVFYSRPGGRFEVYEAHDTTLLGLAKTIMRESVVLRSLGFARPRSLQRGTELDTAPDSDFLRSLPAFERNMGNLMRSCESKGAPVLFLTMPFTLESAHTFLPPGNFFTNDGLHHLAPEKFAEGMRRFNDAVRDLAKGPAAKEHNIYVFDAAAQIVAPALFTDEVHLTDDGQKLEAHLVEQEIVRLGLLKKR